MPEENKPEENKLNLLIFIGNEICEGCGPDRDCGLEYCDCSRIINAARELDEFLEDVEGKS